jgi:hypothetical protein
MQNKFDAETSETELTLKQKAAWLCALLLIGALVLSAALYPVFQQRAQAEKERIALIEKEQAEATKKVEGAAPVKAKVAKKRKGKMVKIALGASGQADFVGTDCYPTPFPGGHWEINGANTVEGDGGAIVDGWEGFEDGQVQVGISGANGNCTLRYYSEVPCEGTPGQYTIYIYEFEVVCVDGEIRIAPVSN